MIRHDKLSGLVAGSDGIAHLVVVQLIAVDAVISVLRVASNDSVQYRRQNEKQERKDRVSGLLFSLLATFTQ